MSAMSCCGIAVVALIAILAYPLYWVWIPPQMHEVKGKCAVITGTSSGLGIDIAKALAAEGISQMILTARRVDKLHEVAANLTKTYPSVKFHPVGSDVTSDEDNAKLVVIAQEKFGDCPVILVNNAGVESWAHFDKMSKKKIDQMLDINLKAAIHLTHDFIPSMIQSGGHIVSIGSIAGKIAAYAMHVYSGSKFGILGFNMGLRAEAKLKKWPVTVHTVMPGFVKDAGMAEDMAKMAGRPLEDVTNVYGCSYPSETGDAVVNSIKYDHPEWVVNSKPSRIFALVREMFPRFMDVLAIPFNAETQKVTFFFFAKMDAEAAAEAAARAEA
jgi:short-subunit dehydrogenase